MCPGAACSSPHEEGRPTDTADNDMDFENTYVRLSPEMAVRLGLAEQSECQCLERDEDYDDTQAMAANEEDFQEVDIVCAGDSACTDHIANEQDIPGYPIHESPGSRAGKGWVAADGMRIPNQGEADLNLVSQGRRPRSTFQVGKVSRPLMSIARICDAGNTVLFNKTHAIVRDSKNNEVCRFERKGQLYLIKFRLTKPSAGFRRPGTN